ncbi:uroporphyrinogen-III C-methyltransferase [Craterilacuibacter sp.]|uniref:uroporphyrinogen-III C-methyltransferase n=1 Tax=Craterilacuibacter sp. TaxID=2870909 RepID=UPI003F33BC30
MSDTPITDIPVTAQGRRSLNLALIVALAALGLSGWQYYETRLTLDQARLSLAQSLADAGGSARVLREQSAATLGALQATDAKLALLEARVNQSAGQYATLEGMYQELTRNRSDWLLAEIEHTLSIASQQLQLAGNVPAAVSALEMVDARLARFDSPQLISLKKSVSKDLIELKALPYLDNVGMTLKLDQLMLLVDTLPLAVDHHRLAPVSATRAALPAHASWWERALSDLSASIGELVRIRRMDKPEALLLSPEQAFFLRENLKMRLLDARIALQGRMGETFNADIVAARSYVERYFDRDAPATQQWLATLNGFKDAPLDVVLPDLGVTLKTVRDAQERMEVKP